MIYRIFIKQRPNSSSIITVKQACFLNLISLLSILLIKAHREQWHDHHNFHHLTDKTQTTTKLLLILCTRPLEFPPDDPSFRSILLKKRILLHGRSHKHTPFSRISILVQETFINQCSIHTQIAYFSNRHDHLCVILSVSYYSDAQTYWKRRVQKSAHHLLWNWWYFRKKMKPTWMEESWCVKKNPNQLLHTDHGRYGTQRCKCSSIPEWI